IAGADIRTFDAFRTVDDSLARSATIHALLRRIEGSPKPVVAAIHGNALGGGLEVAMACHYRLAAAGAKLGQPEVLLGVIPGAGGTQRLPRLAGVRRAIEMCTDGRAIGARTALEAGLLDRLCDPEVLSHGIALARERAAAGEVRRTRDLPASTDLAADLTVCDAARAALTKSRTGAAALAAVESIRAAVTESFDDGSRRERELFAACRVSVESKALRHLFFAEREAAKVPGVPKGTAVRRVARAAILGAGTMGGGIAMAYANAGIPVLLKDVDEAAVGKGLATIRRNYEVTL